MPTDDQGRATGHPAHNAQASLARLSLMAFVLCAGAGGAVQSRANGALSVAWDAPIYAAIWSFVSGWVVLTAGFAYRGVRLGMARVWHGYRHGQIRWWQFLGGVIGGVFVIVQSYVVPAVGVALFLICVVAGQTLGALVVDRLGIGGLGRRALTVSRLLWATLAVAGAALAMSGRAGQLGASGWAMVLLPLGMGLLMAIQTTYNGQVRAVAGSFWVSTWINFTWGCGLLVGLALAQWWVAPMPPFTLLGSPWWAYLGGLLGIVFVAAGAIAVRSLGVLTVMLLLIAGQLLAALALDVANPATREFVGPSLVLGVLITLVAAGGSALWPQRRSVRSAGS